MNSLSSSAISDFVVASEGIHERWDVMIVALGYEERSVHVAKEYSDRADTRVALAFGSSDTLSYGRNATILEDLEFALESMPADVGRCVINHVENVVSEVPRIAIDVSSFTRGHLAQIVDALRFFRRACSIDFLYSPAGASNWQGDVGPITIAQPIHPGFTSWVDDPAAPLAALIGVGVEDNLALGIAEYLDVSYAHAFVPVGGDAAFDSMNVEANSQFFLAEYTVRRSEYKLGDPFRLFLRLESLIYGMSPVIRVAIVPLGPKIFALCGLLAASVSGRSSTVWRFSSSNLASPDERVAAGPIHSLRVEVVGSARNNDRT
jgi:hypothetical protein